MPRGAEAAGASYYVDRTVAGCSDARRRHGHRPVLHRREGVAALRAGDTLYLGNGTYAETVKPAVSGTPAAR